MDSASSSVVKKFQNDKDPKESVEEAVLKYVGVDIKDHGKKSKKRSKKHDKKKKHGSKKSHSDKDIEMDWFLKTSEANNSRKLDDIEPDSVAMAAIAAAYNSTVKEKHKKNRHKDGSGSKSEKKKHHKSKKFKERTAKIKMVLDPELRTLDDALTTPAFSPDDLIAETAFDKYVDAEKAYSVRNSSKPTHVDENSQENNANNALVKNYAELERISSNGSYIKRTAKIPEKDVKLEEPQPTSDEDKEGTVLLRSDVVKASDMDGAITKSIGRKFSPSEEDALDQFIEKYMQIRNLDRQQMCERIWSTDGVIRDGFWANISKVLSYRTRSSIYKHIRRKYHIFEQRGKWTPEEDQELARLCLEKEGHWTEVGNLLGRMPEDCRDRWRNYMKCGSKRGSKRWSKEEEELLTTVVNEMIEEAHNYQRMKETEAANNEDGYNQMYTRGPKGKKVSDNPTFKDMINWTVVSERMSGTRSRIQCRYKWNKLVTDEAYKSMLSIPSSERKWLLEQLKQFAETSYSNINWDSLAASKPDSLRTGLELRLCYEQMRERIEGYKERPMADIINILLEQMN
ncbi:RNA polymerase I termination factor [Saccharomyces pastorianus]|uniref:RNA polymerase I termination factor n=1 Tax=Saccharomyces pastorianus TaxID=27292 RepID=A0A6C1E3B4_SACPS|nr:RNA polymerase I termination factor [Saccharomyces pastorianus]